MSWPLPLSTKPMEAELVAEIPDGPGWQFEPKWDGFRCLLFRDRDSIALQSRKGQPLSRYFPEIVRAASELPDQSFVLDAELVVPVDAHLSFDDLLQRIHPAASRVLRLAAERPALAIVFDLLVDANGTSLLGQPLRARRAALERFAERNLGSSTRIRLSPATTDRRRAGRWLAGAGDAVDGIVAKKIDEPYQPGARALRKVKLLRTADCVIGGFRYASGARVVGSLLLGLYGDDSLLHHVGFTSGFTVAERRDLLARLEPLTEPPGFTGNAPGGPSRWSTERSAVWTPLRPALVAEVRYDHFTGGRFRHGTALLRWRPDKAPRDCTLAQVAHEAEIEPLRLLERRAPARKATARYPRRKALKRTG